MNKWTMNKWTRKRVPANTFVGPSGILMKKTDGSNFQSCKFSSTCSDSNFQNVSSSCISWNEKPQTFKLENLYEESNTFGSQCNRTFEIKDEVPEVTECTIERVNVMNLKTWHLFHTNQNEMQVTPQFDLAKANVFVKQEQRNNDVGTMLSPRQQCEHYNKGTMLSPCQQCEHCNKGTTLSLCQQREHCNKGTTLSPHQQLEHCKKGTMLSSRQQFEHYKKGTTLSPRQQFEHCNKGTTLSPHQQREHCNKGTMLSPHQQREHCNKGTTLSPHQCEYCYKGTTSSWSQQTEHCNKGTTLSSHQCEYCNKGTTSSQSQQTEHCNKGTTLPVGRQPEHCNRGTTLPIVQQPEMKNTSEEIKMSSACFNRYLTVNCLKLDVALLNVSHSKIPHEHLKTLNDKFVQQLKIKKQSSHLKSFDNYVKKKNICTQSSGMKTHTSAELKTSTSAIKGNSSILCTSAELKTHTSAELKTSTSAIKGNSSVLCTSAELKTHTSTEPKKSASAIKGNSSILCTSAELKANTSAELKKSASAIKGNSCVLCTSAELKTLTSTEPKKSASAIKGNSSVLCTSAELKTLTSTEPKKSASAIKGNSSILYSSPKLKQTSAELKQESPFEGYCSVTGTELKGHDIFQTNSSSDLTNVEQENCSASSKICETSEAKTSSSDQIVKNSINDEDISVEMENRLATNWLINESEGKTVTSLLLLNDSHFSCSNKGSISNHTNQERLTLDKMTSVPSSLSKDNIVTSPCLVDSKTQKQLSNGSVVTKDNSHSSFSSKGSNSNTNQQNLTSDMTSVPSSLNKDSARSACLVDAKTQKQLSNDSVAKETKSCDVLQVEKKRSHGKFVSSTWSKEKFSHRDSVGSKAEDKERSRRTKRKRNDGCIEVKTDAVVKKIARKLATSETNSCASDKNLKQFSPNKRKKFEMKKSCDSVPKNIKSKCGSVGHVKNATTTRNSQKNKCGGTTKHHFQQLKMKNKDKKTSNSHETNIKRSGSSCKTNTCKKSPMLLTNKPGQVSKKKCRELFKNKLENKVKQIVSKKKYFKVLLKDKLENTMKQKDSKLFIDRFKQGKKAVLKIFDEVKHVSKALQLEKQAEREKMVSKKELLKLKQSNKVLQLERRKHGSKKKMASSLDLSKCVKSKKNLHLDKVAKRENKCISKMSCKKKNKTYSNQKCKEKCENVLPQKKLKTKTLNNKNLTCLRQENVRTGFSIPPSSLTNLKQSRHKFKNILSEKCLKTKTLNNKNMTSVRQEQVRTGSSIPPSSSLRNLPQSGQKPRFNIVAGSEFRKCHMRLRTCTYCHTFRTRLAAVLKDHVNEKHKYKCAACHTAFPDKWTSRQHHIHWHELERHHCMQCRKTFSSGSAYKKHATCQQHTILLQARTHIFDQLMTILRRSSSELKSILDTSASTRIPSEDGSDESVKSTVSDDQCLNVIADSITSIWNTETPFSTQTPLSTQSNMSTVTRLPIMTSKNNDTPVMINRGNFTPFMSSKGKIAPPRHSSLPQVKHFHYYTPLDEEIKNLDFLQKQKEVEMQQVPLENLFDMFQLSPGMSVDSIVSDITSMDDGVVAAVGDAVDNAVDYAVGDSIDDAVGDAVDDAVGDAIGDAVVDAGDPSASSSLSQTFIEELGMAFMGSSLTSLLEEDQDYRNGAESLRPKETDALVEMQSLEPVCLASTTDCTDSTTFGLHVSQSNISHNMPTMFVSGSDTSEPNENSNTLIPSVSEMEITEHLHESDSKFLSSDVDDDSNQASISSQLNSLNNVSPDMASQKSLSNVSSTFSPVVISSSVLPIHKDDNQSDVPFDYYEISGMQFPVFREHFDSGLKTVSESVTPNAVSEPTENGLNSSKSTVSIAVPKHCHVLKEYFDSGLKTVSESVTPVSELTYNGLNSSLTKSTVSVAVPKVFRELCDSGSNSVSKALRPKSISEQSQDLKKHFENGLDSSLTKRLVSNTIPKPSAILREHCSNSLTRNSQAQKITRWLHRWHSNPSISVQATEHRWKTKTGCIRYRRYRSVQHLSVCAFGPQPLRTYSSNGTNHILLPFGVPNPPSRQSCTDSSQLCADMFKTPKHFPQKSDSKVFSLPSSPLVNAQGDHQQNNEPNSQQIFSCHPMNYQQDVLGHPLNPRKVFSKPMNSSPTFTNPLNGLRAVSNPLIPLQEFSNPVDSRQALSNPANHPQAFLNPVDHPETSNPLNHTQGFPGPVNSTQAFSKSLNPAESFLDPVNHPKTFSSTVNPQIISSPLNPAPIVTDVLQEAISPKGSLPSVPQNPIYPTMLQSFNTLTYKHTPCLSESAEQIPEPILRERTSGFRYNYSGFDQTSSLPESAEQIPEPILRERTSGFRYHYSGFDQTSSLPESTEQILEPILRERTSGYNYSGIDQISYLSAEMIPEPIRTENISGYDYSGVAKVTEIKAELMKLLLEIEESEKKFQD